MVLLVEQSQKQTRRNIKNANSNGKKKTTGQMQLNEILKQMMKLNDTLKSG